MAYFEKPRWIATFRVFARKFFLYFCKNFAEKQKIRHDADFGFVFSYSCQIFCWRSATIRTAISAGETPDILDACPRLNGRMFASFSLASMRSAFMLI